MSTKEIAVLLELLQKLSEEKRREVYYIIKGATIVAEDGKSEQV